MISDDQLVEAIGEQNRTGERLDRVLVRLGMVRSTAPRGDRPAVHDVAAEQIREPGADAARPPARSRCGRTALPSSTGPYSKSPLGLRADRKSTTRLLTGMGDHKRRSADELDLEQVIRSQVDLRTTPLDL